MKIYSVATKDIVVNGLTKALLVSKHVHFMGIIGIEDKKKLLASIK